MLSLPLLLLLVRLRQIAKLAMDAAMRLGRGHPLLASAVHCHCSLLRDAGKRNAARNAAQQFVNTAGHSNPAVLGDLLALLEELGAYVLEEALGDHVSFNALEDSSDYDDDDDDDDDDYYADKDTDSGTDAPAVAQPAAPAPAAIGSARGGGGAPPPSGLPAELEEGEVAV